MAFCSVCGVKLEENASFCSYCGKGVAPQVVYVQRPPKPKVPGRGMGLASMIVGIVGAFYATGAIMATIFYILGLNQSDPAEAVQMFIICSTFCSVPTLIFQAVANSKGYKQKTRLAGLILGVSSLAASAICMLLVLTV